MEYACARLGGFIGSTGGCSPLFIIVECIVLVPSILGYIIGMVGPMVEPMEAMPPPTGVYVLITFVSAGCLNPAKSPPILARPVEIVEFVIIFYSDVAMYRTSSCLPSKINVVTVESS